MQFLVVIIFPIQLIIASVHIPLSTLLAPEEDGHTLSTYSSAKSTIQFLAIAITSAISSFECFGSYSML